MNKKLTAAQRVKADKARRAFREAVFEIFDKELADFNGLTGYRRTVTGQIYDSVVTPLLKKARRRAR